VAGAQGQVTQECGARQLSQLYRHASSFLLLLQTFSWEVRTPHASQPALARVPAAFVTPLAHSRPAGRTLGAGVLPTLRGADPRHRHLPHLPAAGAGQAALLLPRPGQGLVQARPGGWQRLPVRGPVRLRTGLSPNPGSEQSCRTLSCALGAQEGAHRRRADCCSSSLRCPRRRQALLPPRQAPLL